MSERGAVMFGEARIAYTVVRSARRRKTLQITIDPSDGVLVAAPVDAPAERIAEIVRKRAAWIVRRASETALMPRRKEFVSGESLPYLGRQARLFVEHARSKRVTVQFRHWSFHLRVPGELEGEARQAAIERAVVRWYKARARVRLRSRVVRWAAVAGYAPAAVLVRGQRQRWGSCAPDGTLRFNWRIVLAPPRLLDYVVVHELIHLQERNHGPRFWAEVGRLLPDYRARRAELKDLGPTLAI